MTIYIITSGEYSDYHIITATTDKKNAIKIAKRLNRDKGRYLDDVKIEKFEDAAFSPSEKVFYVYLSQGYLSSSEASYGEEYGDAVKQTIFPVYEGWGTYVLADTEEKARKIAEDRFAKFRAEEEGIV